MHPVDRRFLSALTLTIVLAAAPAQGQTEADNSGAELSSTDLGALLNASPLAFRLWPTPADQGVPTPSGPPPTPRHTGIKALVTSLGSDVKHLPSRENLFWAGLGSGLALVAHPFDDNVNRALVGNPTAKRLFRPGRVLGEFGTLFATSTTVYAVGRFNDSPRVSHVGMDLIRALLISEGLTQTLKYVVQRERPDHSSNNSFPSGHSADTFAFATAVERHLGWRYAVPAFLFSSYVAISRLPSNRHWLSDAVFGAAVGIIAGRTVTSNESVKYPVSIVHVPGGVAVMFVRRGTDGVEGHSPRSLSRRQHGNASFTLAASMPNEGPRLPTWDQPVSASVVPNLQPSPLK